jgi:hypothetical protein
MILTVLGFIVIVLIRFALIFGIMAAILLILLKFGLGVDILKILGV